MGTFLSTTTSVDDDGPAETVFPLLELPEAALYQVATHLDPTSLRAFGDSCKLFRCESSCEAHRKQSKLELLLASKNVFQGLPLDQRAATVP
jgi:hypothetical protein